MNSSEIRKRFLDFFEKRGHKIIPSASLVPQNDPSVLFNTAGMQPLVPYLIGEPHPAGKRIVNIQKCVRTQDIDEVGDNTHDTFFEMMGNWSLGDYFKEDAIKWSFEFLTSKDEGLGLDINRLYITCFMGDENAPRDDESRDIWRNLGIDESHIFFLGADDNWWSPGSSGPCGPDTEMFYDLTKDGLGEISKDEFIQATNEQKIVEIWNDVFMEYEKKDDKVIGKLKQQNVDTGAGLERVCMVMQNTQNVFDTDLFSPIMNKVNELSHGDERAKRIVADHVRTSVFLISDSVTPSNSDRGYVLRRLLRRAVRYADIIGMKNGDIREVAKVVIEKYKDVYENINTQANKIVDEINSEENKFRTTINRGMKEFEKIIKDSKDKISGQDAFTLFTTYGFPIELTLELAKEKGLGLDTHEYQVLLKEHQDKSRTAGAGMFKGGLANHNEKTIRLHTAHHLLLSALKEVLGNDVKQKGSNITEGRLRIDFSFDRKLTDEEKNKVEDIVNQKIQEDLTVCRREMKREEAESIGAEMEFGAKYGDIVSVYFIEDKNKNAFSKEFCGGPHVTKTSELGKFKIAKEEAVAQGVRRIKAVLE